MSMTLQTEKRYYTPEEYLVLEETAEYKNEYVQGEIIPMVGGTTNHNRIAGNFYRRFPLAIDTQDYEVYMEGVRLWLADFNVYTYPDVMVIPRKPSYYGTGKTTVTNPLIIVEVLSRLTQGYDRVEKFTFYRTLPSFQEYILIDQYRYAVERFHKQSREQWSVNFYEGEEAILDLASVPWSISLRELYQCVDFEGVEE
jgi:Uma2 family endonuclease